MGFDKEMVRVYNHGRCSVALGLQDRSVLIRGTDDPNYPTMETFTLKELEYVNTHSPVIRVGMVEFDKAEREEIYDALHCKDWRETCVFDSEINDMLINPSLETMQKVLAVKDMPTIDRIYAHMEALIAHNTVDVSNRVQTVVKGRRKELTNGVMTSRIQVTPKKPDVQTFTQEDVAAMVAEQVAAQMSKLVGNTPVMEPVVEEPKTEEPVAPVADPAPAKEKVSAKPKTTAARATTKKTK